MHAQMSMCFTHTKQYQIQFAPRQSTQLAGCEGSAMASISESDCCQYECRIEVGANTVTCFEIEIWPWCSAVLPDVASLASHLACQSSVASLSYLPETVHWLQGLQAAVPLQNCLRFWPLHVRGFF